MRSIVVMSVFVLAAAPAAAQSTYVGASLLGEFSQFGGTDFDGNGRTVPADVESRNGETLGFEVRIGRAIDRRWGVELAFARGGVNEHRQSARLFPAVEQISPVIPSLPGVSPSLPIRPILPIPDFEYAVETEEQHTTIAPTVWVRQELSDRVQLAFSGGISFNRVESEVNTRITDPRLAIYLPFPTDVETTQHHVGPVVGTEAIIGVGEHASLTGGVRLHGVPGGWLLRPSVGLRWSF